MIKNIAFIGLRVNPVFKSLLVDYTEFKSKEAGYFRPVTSVVQEAMYQVMKNDVKFNEYLTKKEA